MGYVIVLSIIRGYNEDNVSDDDFLSNPFTADDICLALKSLNRGKAAGFDKITAEHTIFASEHLTKVMVALYNIIVDLEEILTCFRTGVQIPLFTGKDLDALDPNNYRGITLLSTFNKIFEILVWNRLKLWWTNEKGDFRPTGGL